jgi:spore coat polysaccharide biosynthesis predicted glycosyltransferase SpsG
VHLTVAAPSGTDPPSDLSLELHVGAASLAGDLLNTDLVVCAGGQTMLEALAAGAPCIAVVMAENQRRQADYLAGLGAVRVSDEAGLSTAVDAVAADPGLRTRMSATGQSLIDGYGAFRVAFAIDRVLALKA